MEYGQHYVERYHHMEGLYPNAKQIVIRIKVKNEKHPMHIFGPCSPGSRKWKQSLTRRNGLERIKSRMRRDFLLYYHFLRGKNIHLCVTDSTAAILATYLDCLEKNKPEKMRSLVKPFAT